MEMFGLWCGNTKTLKGFVASSTLSEWLRSEQVKAVESKTGKPLYKVMYDSIYGNSQVMIVVNKSDLLQLP